MDAAARACVHALTHAERTPTSIPPCSHSHKRRSARTKRALYTKNNVPRISNDEAAPTLCRAPGCIATAAPNRFMPLCQLPMRKAPGTQWREPSAVSTHGVRRSPAKRTGPSGAISAYSAGLLARVRDRQTCDEYGS
eukprot:6194325-Pleurochrysis_carterae.AAC.1